MRELPEYADRYDHVDLSREAGVLVARLHTGDGPLVWGASAHRELGECFRDIGQDRANRVVVLTGTGDAFIARSDAASFPHHDGGMTPGRWDTIVSEGSALVAALLDIPVPVVVAVNGPATVHSELGVLGDLVYATPDVVFADSHFARGLVPGDGVHIVWPSLLGPSRGRQYLLLGRQIEAEEALRLGLVCELVPPAQLMARVLAVASELGAQPDLVLRYTRALLARPLREAVASELVPGLALEGLAHPAWPAGAR